MFNRDMGNTNRLRQITDAVREAGSLGVAELALLTGASEMTIRRDLEMVAQQGVLKRFRGGARSLLLRGLHAVITDASAPDDEVQAISAAGVTVRKA